LSADEIKKMKKDDSPEKQDYCTRILLDEDEWKDPACRVVIGEEYKEGVKNPPPKIESDLDAFDEVWKEQGGKNVKAEYHKENAPHLEGSSDLEGQRPQPGKTSEGRDTVPKPAVPKVMPRSPGAEVKPKVGPDPTSEPLNRPIDIAGIEVISYALFRFIFGTGVHIPLKREGLVDMDVTIKRKDIIINTNQFFVAVPDLVVWRIIYTHKGKTIMELGRGVKNGMKIHRYQAILLLIEMWKLSRASRKAKEKAAETTRLQAEAK
jgi:hypothetical protein